MPVDNAPQVRPSDNLSREEQRRINRERDPEFAAFVDELRKAFGDGVEVASYTRLDEETQHEKSSAS